jgi:hypothetical protein
MSEPLHVKTPDAARRLGLTPEALERMRQRGDGPPFIRASRRRIVYAIASLDAWAREREFRSTREYASTASAA